MLSWPNCLISAPTPYTIILGVKFQHMNFEGGHKHSDHRMQLCEPWAFISPDRCSLEFGELREFVLDSQVRSLNSKRTWPVSQFKEQQIDVCCVGPHWHIQIVVRERMPGGFLVDCVSSYLSSLPRDASSHSQEKARDKTVICYKKKRKLAFIPCQAKSH